MWWYTSLKKTGLCFVWQRKHLPIVVFCWSVIPYPEKTDSESRSVWCKRHPFVWNFSMAICSTKKGSLIFFTMKIKRLFLFSRSKALCNWVSFGYILSSRHQAGIGSTENEPSCPTYRSKWGLPTAYPIPFPKTNGKTREKRPGPWKEKTHLPITIFQGSTCC